MLSISESALLFGSSLYLYLAPYTKVEESFTLHAVHDILTWGVSKSAVKFYDHVDFPGVVPRSFIPPMILSSLVYPFLYVGSLFNLWTSLFQIQLLIRAVLAVVTIASIIFLSRRVKTLLGRKTKNIFLLLTVSQFHLLFYASRTLPNILAFPLAQVSLGLILHPSSKKTKSKSHVDVLIAFAILTSVSVIARLELIAYILPLAFMVKFTDLATPRDLSVTIVLTGAIAYLCTYTVDSHFWATPVWPEGSSIFFNVVEGHASKWGVSPWHFYFSRSIPRLIPTFPLGLWAMLMDRRARVCGIPSVFFIGLLSVLEHKEWRFFVYAIPPITVCCATGIYNTGILFGKWAKYILLFSAIFVNMSIVYFSTWASIHNYPGGVALAQFSPTNIPLVRPLIIHLDAHTCSTGVSKFMLEPSNTPWFLAPSSTKDDMIFSRSESVSQGDYKEFDYLFTREPRRVGEGFVQHDTVEAFSGFRIKGLRMEMETEKSIWVLRRNETI